MLRVELRALSEQVDLRFDALERHLTDQDAARTLQATEYERRLLDLNNSHEKAIQVQATYVNKEAMRLETDDMKRRVNLETDRANKTDVDLARLTAAVAQVSAEVASLNASQTWLTRLVIGVVIVALLTFVLGGDGLMGRAT